MKERIILHVDMDAFFASVEQKERRWLEGKPVIVGGDPRTRRGVVSAASYPARKYGVGAGMSLALAKTLCPHAIIITLTDMEKYTYISSQLVKIFYHFTPLVEPFSIDEAFLDITGCQRLFGKPSQIAQKLKNEIKNKLGLSCSVGIAPNKLLAKLASSLNKPDGLTIISKDRVRDTLCSLEVGKLWGIGEKTSKVLSKFGIRTVGELASYPVQVLKNEFGKVGEHLHLIANGIDDSVVLADVPIEKSMGHEHTLPKDTNDPDEISSVLLSLSTMVARRLRQKRFQGRTVTLKLRYSDLKAQNSCFVTLTRSETIHQPTDSEHKIYKVAKNLALNQYGSGQASGLRAHPYGCSSEQNSCLDLGIRKARLLGVSVSNLVRDNFSFQTSFPFPEYYDKNGSTTFTIKREVYSVMDKIKDRFGEDSVTWATSLIFW